MKAGTLKISKPKDEARFIWKYLDIHRFIYFLTQQKLVFTRLDNLEDLFEGIETTLLKKEEKKTSPRLLHTLSKKGKGKKITKSQIDDYSTLEALEKAQKSQYVNCWFTGDRESMAMWNVYSNPDSVALKASFTSLIESLKTPFKDFITLHGNRHSIIGDQITYLRLNPFDETRTPRKVSFSALKKDVSFEYENEYRFLIIDQKKDRIARPFYSIPVNPEDMDFTIVTHPNMEDWKYKNIQQLVRLCGFNLQIQKSATILRMNK